MNLEESDKFVEKQRQKEQKKKIVLVSIVLCVILIALLVIMIIYIQYQDSLELKMYVDGQRVTIYDDTFKEQDDVTYVNIKEFSELFGYTYTKGEYKKYNENSDSCYIKNNIEIVAMTAEKGTFVKYIDVDEGSVELTEDGPYGMEISIASQNGDSNTFVLENPVKVIDDELYLPFEYLTDVFNVRVDTSTENRIRIYTLPNLFQTAMNIAAQLEYTTISGIYENIRAIPYGLVVVGNNGIFGVIDLTTGQEILSVKYEDLEFIQNSEEFFMRAENTVGLLDKEGNTIIKPTDYDDISILDEIEQLYLVEKDKKYGVVNRKGEIIIHVDYDEIGLDNIEDFELEDLRNQNLLFDKCIVAEADGKYGLYDVTGKELLKTTYEGFGYVSDTSGEDSVIAIPDSFGFNGLVIKYNDLYGIYDVDNEQIVVPTVYSKIYSITKAGKTTYYADFGGSAYELGDILDALNQENSRSSKQSNNDEEVTDENEDEIVVEE